MGGNRRAARTQVEAAMRRLGGVDVLVHVLGGFTARAGDVPGGGGTIPTV